jgi:hypothetical protein
MKKLLVLLLLLAVVAGSIGYYFFNKKVDSLENTEAHFSLTADELFNAFEQNEVEAQKKYVDKVLLVSGLVSNVKLQDSLSTVVLAAENAMIGGVNCSFSIQPKGVSKGETVSIKGRCQGFLMDVVLNNCVIAD